MAAYIDQHLTSKLHAAREPDLIEAILIVKEYPGASPGTEDSGLARQVIEKAVARTGDHPQRVRYFPRANAAVLTASARLIREILKDEDLAVASAADVDPFPFPAQMRLNGMEA